MAKKAFKILCVEICEIAFNSKGELGLCKGFTIYDSTPLIKLNNDIINK